MRCFLRSGVTLVSSLVVAACGGGGGGSDSGGDSPSNINDAPTISGNPATAVEINTDYVFVPNADDPDLGVDSTEVLTFTIENLPTWAEFDSASGKLSGIAADLGTFSGIVISVTDSKGLRAALPAFDILVANEVIPRPVISGSPATAVDERAFFSFTPNVESQSQTLTFATENQPIWADFDVSNGTLSGTPDASHIGDFNDITISVTDDLNQTESLQFNLSVRNVNDAPTITGVPATSVEVNAAYTFTPNADDPDLAVDSAEVLTFTIENLPSWATFDSANGTLSGAPTAPGSFSNIIMSVRDTLGLSAQLPAFELVVSPLQTPPTIASIPPSTVDQYAVYSFTPQVTDPDLGESFTYSIQNKPSWAEFDAAKGTLSGVPTAADIGVVNDVSITVTDKDNLQDTLIFNIEVTSAVAPMFDEALFAFPASNVGRDRLQDLIDGFADNGSPGWRISNPVGKEVRINFDSTKAISRLVLTDHQRAGERVLESTITFSDGSAPLNTGPFNDNGSVELIFLPKQLRWINIRIDSIEAGTANAGFSEIEAYSLTDGQTVMVSERFRNSAANWVEVDDSQSGRATWSVADTDFSQLADAADGPAKGYSVDGEDVGTNVLLDSAVFSHDAVDLRVRLRSSTAAVDPAGNPPKYDTSVFSYGSMGVLFGYQDFNNHYRFELNYMSGQRKLLKRVDGRYAELASTTRSYSPDEFVNVRVLANNGTIIVFVNGEQAIAAVDPQSPYNSGQIGIMCAWNISCTLDKAVALSFPVSPLAALGSPREFSVTTSDTLQLTAIVQNDADVSGVEFVVDEGTPEEQSIVAAAPYQAQMAFASAGDHDVAAYLLDAASLRITTVEATDAATLVAANGVNLVAMGDSITNGEKDDEPFDDVSVDGRDTTGGYLTVLNDLLSDGVNGLGLPVTVIDEGNRGEVSAEGAVRISDTLARSNGAEAFLLLYGANDSRTSGINPNGVPSGQGTQPGDTGYNGSYKDNMQQIIDAVVVAGKKVFVAKNLMRNANNGDNDGADLTRNNILAEYNQVIDELLSEIPSVHPTWDGVVFAGPDLSAVFTGSADAAVQSLYSDNVHPNGVGYQRMGEEWSTVLKAGLRP